MSKRKYQRVEVEWEDACYNSGYYSPEKAKIGTEHVPITCLAIGFLLKHDRKRIVLASEYFPQDDDMRRVNTIPRKMIKKITRLKAEVKHA